jgi:hypothetical protein
MTPELLTAILGAGGLSVIVPKLIDGIRAWRSGRAQAEKEKNRGLANRLVGAEVRADYEAAWRRILQDHVATLRVLLIGQGIPAESLPPWPEPPDKPEEEE